MNDMTPSRQSTGRTTHYINGRWSETGGRTFADYNPFDGSTYAEIAAGGRAEAQAAVDAAAAAFPAWAAATPRTRQTLFLKAADIVERRAKEFATTMALETGAGAAFSGFLIRWSIDMLRQAAGWGYLPIGDVLASDVPGRFAMAVRKPLGVVAGFSPWNGSFSLAWRTVVLPMVFGNTVVLKPSEFAPISAGLLLAEVLDEAGFPPGVMNVVTHAPGEHEAVTEVFFERPEVRSINFTGLLRHRAHAGGAGRPVAEAHRAGARRLQPAAGAQGRRPRPGGGPRHLLGLLPPGPDLHERPEDPWWSSRCTTPSWSGWRPRPAPLKAGDPTTPGVFIGPLIHDRAVKAVDASVKDAVARGATLVTGGEAQGPIYPPTILTHVPADAPINREETFGPVMVIEATPSAEAALTAASDTNYGPLLRDRHRRPGSRA